VVAVWQSSSSSDSCWSVHSVLNSKAVLFCSVFENHFSDAIRPQLHVDRPIVRRNNPRVHGRCVAQVHRFRGGLDEVQVVEVVHVSLVVVVMVVSVVIVLLADNLVRVKCNSLRDRSSLTR